MRLVTFRHPSGLRAGIVRGDAVVDLVNAGVSGDVAALIADWEANHEQLLRAAERDADFALADIVLDLPFVPGRILGTGGNYTDHLSEMAVSPQEAPSAFCKLPGSELGPGQPVELEPDDRYVDYEGEIALVLGRPARDLDPREALSAVVGLALANDISARDVAMPHAVLAKGHRGFCPIGPAVVTADEVDFDDITITVSVNGEVRQDAHTSNLVFAFGEIVSSYSHTIPLQAGDVILTGTPSGVGVGRRPPVFLRPGDVVHVSSPQLGVLATPIVAAA